MNTFRYQRITRWSPQDRCFLVTVPDLPGCMADGRTAASSNRAAEQVIAEWIDMAEHLGREIPKEPVYA